MSKRSKVFLLAYDKPFIEKTQPGISTFYYPNTTWAEGRNILLAEAKKEIFDYVIFLDDDVNVSKGSFIYFENKLIDYKPWVGLPLCNEIKNSNRYLKGHSIQRPVALDQLVQAYSFGVVTDNIVLPFVTDFDSSSWWMSCEINAYLILRYYYENTLQFNDFEVINSNHAWEEGNSPVESIYLGGMSEQQRRELREYIILKYGNQPGLSGTLFHPKFLPQIVYSISLKDLLFEVRKIRNFRMFLRSIRHAIQLLKSKFVFSLNWIFNKKQMFDPRISL